MAHRIEISKLKTTPLIEPTNPNISAKNNEPIKTTKNAVTVDKNLNHLVPYIPITNPKMM